MNTKQRVERLMREDLRTRDCDNWLVILFFKDMGVDLNLNFAQCLALPSFEVITRARRKIQEQIPELKSSPIIQEKRSNAGNKFTKEYGREDYSKGMMANSQLC